MPSPHRQRRTLFIVLVAFAVIWFGNLDYRKLFHPDEGRYAEIPREMLATGNWLTPRLNGIKYFEKPPLQYWATAGAFAVFGQHDWTARLWSALTGFAGVFLVWYAGRRVFGEATGNYAAVVLASSALYVAIGHFNSLDMGVTLFLTAALCGFLIAQREDSTRDEERRWMLFAWGMMALATLSKGLMGAVLPLLTLIAYCVLQRDFSIWKRLHLRAGLLLYFGLAAPWFVAVSIVNPEFAGFFFIHEHFTRFATTVHHRSGPIWYFVPVLLLGLIPWIAVFAAGLPHAWRKEQLPVSFSPRRFIVVYICVVFVFFSVSGSKLISYILPLFPAAAMLTGWHLVRLRSRSLAWQLLPGIVLALGFFVYILTGADWLRGEQSPNPLHDAYANWLIVALVLLALGLTYALVTALRDGKTRAILTTGITGLICAQLIASGYETQSPIGSAHAMAVSVAPYLKAGVPIYSVQSYDQTFPFYLKHTMVLVNFQDEMSFGLQQEPQLAINNLEEFEARWRRHPDALAAMGETTFQLLTARQFPMEVIARDTRRIVVRKP